MTGGNSGYQAINLSVQFGANRILLLGFDMTIARGIHWHGRHPDGMCNPSEGGCRTWRKTFAAAIPDLRALGVTVINCSRETALTCFPRAKLETVL